MKTILLALIILSAYGTYAQGTYYNGNLIPLSPDSVQPGYLWIDSFGHMTINWYRIQSDTFGILHRYSDSLDQKLYCKSLVKYRPPIIRKYLWRSNWEYFGKWTYFYKNGNKVSEVTIEHEKWNGEYNRYFKNGTIKQHGSFRNNKKTGEWVTYNKSGEVVRRKNFK